MGKNYWEEYFVSTKNEDWSGARIALEHLSNLEQKNPQVHLKLGDMYQRLGNSANAIAEYHHSARLLKNQGFIQKALALCKIILRLDSENDETQKLSKELMMELENAKAMKSSISSIGTPIINESFKEKPEIQEKVEIILLETPEAPEKAGISEDTFIYMNSLFSPLPKEEAQRLIGDIIPQLHASGQTIIEEGDAGDSIYLIKAGHAKVVSHILGREIELAILSPGDVFGEVAFLTGRPRTASVIALDNLEVIEIDKFLLQEIIEAYPETVKQMHDFYECRVQDTVEKVKSTIKK